MMLCFVHASVVITHCKQPESNDKINMVSLTLHAYAIATAAQSRQSVTVVCQSKSGSVSPMQQMLLRSLDV